MSEQRQERREFSRFNLLVDVAVTKKAAGSKEKLLMAKNISKGGICIIAYEELKPRDILELKIYLPDELEPVVVSGSVIWAKPFSVGQDPSGARYDAGIQFVDADEKTLAKLNKYLFSHSESK